jgi:hypothetical protein
VYTLRNIALGEDVSTHPSLHQAVQRMRHEIQQAAHRPALAEVTELWVIDPDGDAVSADEMMAAWEDTAED